MAKDLSRFFSRIEKTSTCWLWMGARLPRGYGVFAHPKTRYAHRLMWIIEHGDIPAGLMVCHKCDNPPCVNPDHLFLGTAQDNHNDAIKKGRSSRNRGSANPMSKLTEKKAATIRKSQQTAKKIAARFGVSLSIVYRIRRGEGWNHDV